MGCFVLSTLHLISNWLLMLENWIYFAIWWVSSTQFTEKAAVGEIRLGCIFVVWFICNGPETNPAENTAATITQCVPATAHSGIWSVYEAGMTKQIWLIWIWALIHSLTFARCYLLHLISCQTACYLWPTKNPPRNSSTGSVMEDSFNMCNSETAVRKQTEILLPDSFLSKGFWFCL